MFHEDRRGIKSALSASERVREGRNASLQNDCPGNHVSLIQSFFLTFTGTGGDDWTKSDEGSTLGARVEPGWQ